LLGRSLCVFPLEWWYLTFSKEDIYFIYMEEMQDRSGEPINQLGQFLGLPNINFSFTLSEGMFDVKLTKKRKSKILHTRQGRKFPCRMNFKKSWRSLFIHSMNDSLN
jgi:hypothetical protein